MLWNSSENIHEDSPGVARRSVNATRHASTLCVGTYVYTRDFTLSDSKSCVVDTTNHAE